MRRLRGRKQPWRAARQTRRQRDTRAQDAIQGQHGRDIPTGRATEKTKVFNQKHSFYRNTRCTNVAQEEQSALPAGVVNVYEDSDDDEAYTGEQREIAREMDELRVAQHWVNQAGWDAAAEGRAVSNTSGKTIDLRLDWGDVKKKLARGSGGEGPGGVSAVGDVPFDEAAVLRDYPLDRLDPTQRAFADRVLTWAEELVSVYQAVLSDGKDRPLPLLRSWLGGSAGSGKSTTLKTVVQHIRLLIHRKGVDAKVELTAYTGWRRSTLASARGQLAPPSRSFPAQHGNVSLRVLPSGS